MEQVDSVAGIGRLESGNTKNEEGRMFPGPKIKRPLRPPVRVGSWRG
jgi:hypothetical protein